MPHLVLLGNLGAKLIVLVLQLDREGVVIGALEDHWAARLPNKAVACASSNAIPESLQVQVGTFG